MLVRSARPQWSRWHLERSTAGAYLQAEGDLLGRMGLIDSSRPDRSSSAGGPAANRITQQVYEGHLLCVEPGFAVFVNVDGGVTGRSGIL